METLVDVGQYAQHGITVSLRLLYTFQRLLFYPSQTSFTSCACHSMPSKPIKECQKSKQLGQWWQSRVAKFSLVPSVVPH